jgi:hypothetical protein
VTHSALDITDIVNHFSNPVKRKLQVVYCGLVQLTSLV